ncbi:hypothetical protein [Desulfatibacillum alkenivorans]|jgi:hypothetical protein|uniref:hypothetical protein n=1 Tax=Desulfatibacillum alkenivorans TaxID=259354 RepID=UPI0009F91B36|nr:hypothetical protein [Desulfatibacillum alkenivorans]
MQLVEKFNGGSSTSGVPDRICRSTITALDSMTVGIVQEHRFAFYYWAKHSMEDAAQTILISLDSHDDSGVPNEVKPEDLDSLNLKNDVELGLFARLRLRSLNDGHILPALYLNFFFGCFYPDE